MKQIWNATALLASFATFSFASTDSDFCSDYEALGKIQISAPEILKYTAPTQTNATGSVVVKFAKMSNGNWPAQLQVLATETPWADHDQDCEIRSKDRGKSCWTTNANDVGTITINTTRLPDNRAHTLFVRALPCANQTIPYSSGWGSGKNGSIFVAQRNATNLQARSMGSHVAQVSFVVKEGDEPSLTIASEEELNTSASTVWKSIPISTIAEKQIVNQSSFGDSIRYEVLFLPKKIWTAVIPERMIARLLVNGQAREVSFKMRADHDLDHMIASLVSASDENLATLWSTSVVDWYSRNSSLWLEFANHLNQAQVPFHQYDDLLVGIAKVWPKLLASQRKAKIVELIGGLNYRAREPLVRLEVKEGSSLIAKARNYARLQILGSSLKDLWVPGRMLQVYRSNTILSMPNVFQNASKMRTLFPGDADMDNAVKGFIDSGLVLVPPSAGSHELLVRFIPAYFDLPQNAPEPIITNDITNMQRFDAVQAAIIGQEIIDGKRLPGFLVVQPGAPAKVFELREPKSAYKVTVLGSAVGCADRIQATVSAPSTGLPQLRVTATSVIPNNVSCELNISELDAKGEKVLSYQAPIVASALLFTGFQNDTTLMVPDTVDYELQVHPDLWSGKFGKAVVNVSMKDPFFMVNDKEFDQASFSTASAYKGEFYFSGSYAARTNFEAQLSIEGRTEPVLRQTINLSSVNLKVSLNDHKGTGVYLDAQKPLLIQVSAPPLNISNWKLSVKTAGIGSVVRFKVANPVSLEDGKTDYSVDLVPDGESERLGDQRVIVEYGYTESGVWHSMAEDSVTFTVASCESEATEKKIGNERYILEKFTPTSSTPDVYGYCNYANQSGKLNMKSFGLQGMGDLSFMSIPITSTVITKAIGGGIVSVASSGIAGATFHLGNTLAFQATLAGFDLQESFSNQGASVLFNGKMNGSITLPANLKMGGSGFELQSGLTGTVAINLANSSLQIANIQNVRFSKLYQVLGLSQTPLEILLANYDQSDINDFSALADQAVIRGELQLLQGNLKVPADLSATFAANSSAMKYEYDLLQNQFRLYGQLDAPVDLGLKYRWLGFADDLCPTIVNQSKLRLRIMHDGHGVGQGLALGWDDTKLCSGPLEIRNINSDDLLWQNQVATINGFQSADIKYQWPAMKMSMQAKTSYTPSATMVQNWSNVEFFANGVLLPTIAGSASVTDGKDLHRNWNSEILFNSKTLTAFAKLYDLETIEPYLGWSWVGDINLKAQNAKMDLPRVHYHWFGNENTVAATLMPNLVAGQTAYQIQDGPVGEFASAHAQFSIGGTTPFTCINGSNVGLGFNCFDGKGESGYRIRNLSKPGIQWQGTMALVSGSGALAQNIDANGMITSCDATNKWWSEKFANSTSFVRASNLNLPAVNASKGFLATRHDSRLDISAQVFQTHLTSNQYDILVSGSGCAIDDGDQDLFYYKDAVSNATNSVKTWEDITTLEYVGAGAQIQGATAKPNKIFDALNGLVKGYPISLEGKERIQADGTYAQTVAGTFASLTNVKIAGSMSVEDGQQKATYRMSAELDKFGVGYLDYTRIGAESSGSVKVRQFIKDPVSVTISSNSKTWVMQGILNGELWEQWTLPTLGAEMGHTILPNNAESYILVNGQPIDVQLGK